MLTTANVARDHVKCSSIAAGWVASLALLGYPAAFTGAIPGIRRRPAAFGETRRPHCLTGAAGHQLITSADDNSP